MMLINDFFNIVETESNENGFACKIKLNPEHYIYHAHFPGNPVTPGVCLLQMATEILEEHYNKKLTLETAVDIKFKKTIKPEMDMSFVFSKINIEDDKLSVAISVENESAKFTKMSLRYFTK